MRGVFTSYLQVCAATSLRAERSLRTPTLVVWGSKDRLVDPALAPRLAATVPDARLLVLDGVGHVAMLEAPEPTARAVLGMVETLGPEGVGGNVPVGPGCSRHATERETLTR